MRYFLAIFLIVLLASTICSADEVFKITYYCSCSRCCGKSDGITASGEKAREGFVACNWLDFGTKLLIDGKTYVVKDRGAKSLFGTRKNPIKHIDIWVSSHKEVLNSGVKWLEVKIKEEK